MEHQGTTGSSCSLRDGEQGDEAAGRAGALATPQNLSKASPGVVRGQVRALSPCASLVIRQGEGLAGKPVSVLCRVHGWVLAVTELEGSKGLDSAIRACWCTWGLAGAKIYFSVLESFEMADVC